MDDTDANPTPEGQRESREPSDEDFAAMLRIGLGGDASNSTSDAALPADATLNDVVAWAKARWADGEDVDEAALRSRYAHLMPKLAEHLRWARPQGFQGDSATATVAEDDEATRAWAGPQPTPPVSDDEDSSTANDARPRLKLDGYDVVREVSRGGQAVVFDAAQQATGRRVAIKVLLNGPMASRRDLVRFDREAKVLATLDHPGVVKVLDRRQTAGGAECLVMDFVAGRGLDDWLSAYYERHPGLMIRASCCGCS